MGLGCPITLNQTNTSMLNACTSRPSSIHDEQPRYRAGQEEERLAEHTRASTT